MPAPAPTATLAVRAYLRMRAAPCSTADGQRGLVLALRDTAGLFPDGFTAQWLGPDALDFLDHHHADLAPGRCLDLEIYNLRPALTGLRARIKTCQLAPLAPSWLRHAEKAAQPPAPTQ